MVSINDSVTALQISKTRLDRALGRLERSAREASALLQNKQLEAPLGAKLKLALGELEDYVHKSRNEVERAMEFQEEVLVYAQPEERRRAFG